MAGAETARGDTWEVRSPREAGAGPQGLEGQGELRSPAHVRATSAAAGSDFGRDRITQAAWREKMTGKPRGLGQEGEGLGSAQAAGMGERKSC